jgi:hypothetical protein
MRLPRLSTALAASVLAAASASATAQTVWIGPEIPVNAVTAGSQFAPAIAATGDGGFVAAWQSSDADGSGFGVRARRFHADGSPATGEIPVNVTTAGDQVTPAVAVINGARFVVVWASNGQDGDGYGVFARVFATDGAPVSAEIPVNDSTAGSQVAPRVEKLFPGAPGAGFLVIWTGPDPAGDTNEIFARGFLGNPLTPAAEFRVNATVSGHQLSPALLRLADDSFVAAWASEGQDGSGYAVVARRFHHSGTFFTAEIPVPQITALDQLSPAVASVAGGFVVAWQRTLQSDPQPVGPQPIVVFRRFALDGTPISDEEQVNFDTSFRHERPALASDVDGGFIVAWRETDLDPEDKNVVAARFDSGGTPDGGAFRMNTTDANDQIDPVLAPGALAGRFVAAWSSFGQDGSSYGVFAQRFGVAGAPCVADATTLCLQDNRFRIRATFATAAGATGDAQAEPLTGESGYFTFFNPENVEIVVKAVDACGLAGFENFWIFATGLTNVEVTLTAEDTTTGDAQIYRNDLNHDFQPILDTAHFHVCGSSLDPLAAGNLDSSRGNGVATADTLAPAASTGTCVADADTLCLLGARFEVTIDWTTAQGGSGQGQAIPLTDESGYFWFFDAANVELVIKVVDGCTYNDRYWIFAGGLTDVGTHLLVRDTANPTATFERVKPIGPPFAPILSIDAFATCP